MKKIIYALIASAVMILAGSCQKLQYPESDSSTTLSTLKCYVFYDPDNTSNKQEVNLLSGTYNEERGIISFTFPNDSKYTSSTLSHCHVEATIPTTAQLVQTDAAGNSLGYGFGESVDLYNTTIYFNIVAADGTVKAYQLTCKTKNQ